MKSLNIVQPSTKQIVIFASGFGLLMALVKILEMSFFSGMISTKIYITIIGVLFLAIGLYLGTRVRGESGATQTVEIAEPKDPSNDGLLSARELEVLEHVAQGNSNKEIAETLFVSENTIKKHLGNIFAKLEVSRRTQAVSRARELGVIK